MVAIYFAHWLPLAMILSLKVKPNSRQNAVTRDGDMLVVRIHAPAHEGKANKALVIFLATAMHIPKSRINIVSGLSSPFKRIELPDEFNERVTKWINLL